MLTSSFHLTHLSCLAGCTYTDVETEAVLLLSLIISCMLLWNPSSRTGSVTIYTGTPVHQGTFNKNLSLFPCLLAKIHLLCHFEQQSWIFSLMDQRKNAKSNNIFSAYFISYKGILKGFIFMLHQKETNKQENGLWIYSQKADNSHPSVLLVCVTKFRNVTPSYSSHVQTQKLLINSCHSPPQIFSKEKVVRHCIWALWQP